MDPTLPARHERLRQLGYLPDPKAIPWTVEQFDLAYGMFQDNHGDEFALEGYGVHKRECRDKGV